jgi:DnaK suppressor protein
MSVEPLSDAQREALGRHLREELEALEGEIASLVQFTAPVAPDSAIGRLSRMEAMNEKSVNEAALRSARAREARIRAALPRLADEDFGLCERCDDSIPFARLKSMPGTRLCVSCAEKAEA